MRISVNWLKDYISINMPVSQLVEVLNNIGLLVEGWEERNDDLILELETYANRPDTLGHLGVARELAAALNLPLHEKEHPVVEVENNTSELIDIQIIEEELCPRYCGIVVRNVPVGPSPPWVRERLEAMGLKPINNVVDVSNLVLFSTAHPVHTFDLTKISGGRIIVRRAQKGEQLITLEGEKLSLSPEMLVIADTQKPVALAGVIGGENTSITPQTRDVFIESAYFDPVSIRKTSKKTGIQTDASYRFERGADLSFPPQAALLTASLLCEMGGRATQGVMDVYPRPLKSKTVVLRHHRLCRLLGLEIEKGFVEKILAKLGFHVERAQDESWRVKIPSFRVDIGREADLIEEIARFYGYDKVPSLFPPLTEMEPVVNQNREKINKLREVLFRYGFNEVINYSFLAPEKEVIFETGLKPICIKNPISSKASLLRTTLLDGLLENIKWNRNRGASGVHLFEVGNIYYWKDHKYEEASRLSMATAGYFGDPHWEKGVCPTGFFHIKGTVEAFMERLRYQSFVFKEEEHPYLEPGNSLLLYYKGENIGSLGLLRKNIGEEYSVEEKVWIADLNLQSLFAKQPQPFSYNPVPRFPYVTRDVSFIADKNIPYQEVKEALDKLNVPYLQRFILYDRYTGSSVPPDKVSLSLRFIFCHPQKTLLAEEVDRLQQKIIHGLKVKFGFKLREGG